MAYNFTQRNNYIFIEPDSGPILIGRSADVKVLPLEDPERYRVSGLLRQDNIVAQEGIPIEDINVEGVAATTETFTEWYTQYTGFNRGGSAPTQNAGYIVNSQTSGYVSDPEPEPITIPANSQIYEVYNVTQGVQLVQTSDWMQSGNELIILNGAADGDSLQVSYLTAVDITPPSGALQTIIYIESQDSTGFINPQVKRNEIGLNFTFTRTDVGTFTISNFDPSIHFVEGQNVPSNGLISFSVEGGNVLNTQRFNLGATEPYDGLLEFGGWIVITKP